MRTAEKATILVLAAAFPAWAAETTSRWSPTNIFAPASTPADEIFRLSLFVLSITAAIFIVVFSLLVYASIKFRERRGDNRRGRRARRRRWHGRPGRVRSARDGRTRRSAR